MSDAGEGLIDADSRIQERMDELERARRAERRPAVANPAQLQALESLRLARAELRNQLNATTHEHRRTQLAHALAEVDRRLADLEGEPATT